MAKNPRGRPTLYTPDLANSICDQLAEGQTLQSICRKEGMPSWRAVYDWMDRHPDFSASIARARDIGADAIAEEALQIADTPMEGEETEINEKGETKIKRGDMLGHRKLQIETRLKLLAKWNPKKYGEAKAEVTGASTVVVLRGGAPDDE